MSDLIIENGVLQKYTGYGGKVVIPEGVTAIGEKAFSGCKYLTSITIPDGVTTIGDEAFRGCKALPAVIIPDSVTSIGKYAFCECNSLTRVEIPNSLTSTGEFTFYGCRNLTAVTIPDSVTIIGDGAFRECRRLTTVNIPARVTAIGDFAFYCCESLPELTIPDSVTTIGECAFHGCNGLTRITIPDSVTHIGMFAFSWGRNLEQLKLVLSGSAGPFLTKHFSNSDKLRISVPDLAALPAKLRLCAALCYAEDGGEKSDPRYESHIKYLKANSGKIVEIAAQNLPLLTLLCREGCIKAKDIEAYTDAVQKTGDAERITMILEYQNSSLTGKQKEKAAKQKEKQENTVFDRAIARMDREGIAGLNFVVTGDVETFGKRSDLKAFLESQGAKLQSAMSSKTDYLIMNDARSNTEKAQRAKELGIDIITERRFNELAGRAYEIKDGDLVEYRGAGGDITIPEGVASIGIRAFSGCEALTGVTISHGVTLINYLAFFWCNNLRNVTIPESVTAIAADAFPFGINLTIYGKAGSYAESYAKERNIPFQAQ